MEDKKENKVVVSQLEVDRELINTSFESYRLKRDSKNNVLSEELPGKLSIQQFKLSNSDYSFCHNSMAANINNLYIDRFNPSQVYFIAQSGSVFGSFISTNEDDSIQCTLKNVFIIPDFNAETMYASLSFPSTQIALILLSCKCARKFLLQNPDYSLGHVDRNEYDSKLFILERSLVDNNEKWSLTNIVEISRFQFFSNLILVGSSHFHLYDSALQPQPINNQSVLNIVIGSVNEFLQTDTNLNQIKSRFSAMFHQMEFCKQSETTDWILNSNARYIETIRDSNDFPKYISLGNADDILFVSQSRLNFCSIEDRALFYNGIDNNFVFSQTNEQVIFKLNLDTLKLNNLESINILEDIHIDVKFGATSLNIRISHMCYEKAFLSLSGKLEQSINEKECHYEIIPKNNDIATTLVITMIKQQSNELWLGYGVRFKDSCLINCRISSELYNDYTLLMTEITDNEVIRKEQDEDEDLCDQEKEPESHVKAEFTKAVFDEYENCDLPDSDASLILTQFESKSGKVLQEFDLSTQQWLFSMPNFSAHNRLPYFVTRHSVDAFIYEPRSEKTVVDSKSEICLKVKHLDSFPAFGYVCASKQNRRFMTFGQDSTEPSKTKWNYAVIDNWAEALLYVYEKPFDNALNNENKTNSAINAAFGQQLLFHFDQTKLPRDVSRPMVYGLRALPTFADSILTRHQWRNAVYVLSSEKLHLVLF